MKRDQVSISRSRRKDSQTTIVVANERDLDGHVDSCGPVFITGWVFDKNRPSEHLEIEVLMGGVRVATALANLYRSDLEKAGMGNGSCAFSLPLPDNAYDGQDHDFVVRELSLSQELQGSQRKFRGEIGNRSLLRLHGYSISGSSRVPDAEKVEEVEFWDDEKYLGTASTRYIPGLPVIEYCMRLPDDLFDDRHHSLSVRVRESSLLLAKIEIPLLRSELAEIYATDTGTGAIVGSVDECSLTGIKGWAFDERSPDLRVELEVFVDDCSAGVTIAADFRADLIGLGDGQHAFSIPTPPEICDGEEHTLTVKELKTGTFLSKLTRSFRFPLLVNGRTLALKAVVSPTIHEFGGSNTEQSAEPGGVGYVGSIDRHERGVFSGWIVDLSNVALPVKLEVFLGGTKVMTVQADQYHDDNKGNGLRSGFNGFEFDLPPLLQTSHGQHLELRPKGVESVVLEHRICSLKKKPSTVGITAADYSPVFLTERRATGARENGITYEVLRKFGFRLLGPIFAPFVVDTSFTFAQHKEPVHFLMREGHHLQSLFDRQFKRLKTERQDQLRKLYVSRAFLFKLLLLEEEHLTLALSSHYVGNLSLLLKNRFALSDAELSQVDAPKRLLEMSIELPKDRDYVATLLPKLCQRIRPAIDRSRDVYREYLAKVVSESGPLRCVDIGFSGTTQKLLSQIFGISTVGDYLFLSEKFGVGTPDCSATGYWSAPTFGKGNPLIDYSLVAEGIFTAPHGQLLDVRKQREGFEFVCGPKTNVQEQFYMTSAIVDGIDDYADFMMGARVDGDGIADLMDVEQAYELQLKFDRSAEMTWLKKFLEVDDHISGFGMIKPFGFLQGLSHD